MPEQHTNHEVQIRQLFAALFAVLVAIIYLRISQIDGRLAADLTFDDVGYANDAARRLLMAAENGLFAFVRSFAESPPHSPFSTLLAVGAFAIGGLDEFALYASNTLVLVVVATLVAYEVRHARRTILLLVLCIVLLSPISYRTIHDFRPDMALGFATATMVWWFFGGLIEGKPRLFRMAGYALGSCLLIKPSFFAHTLAIALFLSCLVVLVRFFARLGLGFKTDVGIRDMSWFLALGILIPAPYFIVNWTHTFQYFWEHTQGGQANIWSFAKDTPIFEVLRSTLELTFHLLGYHLLFSGVALLLCGSMFLVHRAKVDFIRIAAVCGTALVSLCIIVIGRHKNEFFLASFQWMLLLSAVFAIARLDQRLQKGSLRLLGASIAGLLLTIRMNGTLTHWRNSPEALRPASWNQKIVDLIHRHQNAHVDVSAKGESPAVFVSIAGPVNSETLRWVGTRQGFNLDAFDSNFSADIALAKASAERATYVVLPNQLRADYFRWLPSASVQPSLLEWVLSNRRFKPLSSVSQESNYFVFVNASLFEANLGEVSVDGFTLLEGFLGEEGPYPKWALPRVRWMNKKSSRLCVLKAPIIPHRVSLRFRADKEGQFDISDSDGALLASVALTPGKFTDITLTYTPKAKKNCLNFSVRIDAPANPERLLLFSRIELRGE